MERAKEKRKSGESDRKMHTEGESGRESGGGSRPDEEREDEDEEEEEDTVERRVGEALCLRHICSGGELPDSHHTLAE